MKINKDLIIEGSNTKLNDLVPLIPITLYDNPSGKNENITLNSHLANYEYVEVYYGADGVYVCEKIYTPNQKKITLALDYVGEDNTHYYYTSTYSMNGTSIVFNNARNDYINFNDNVVSSFGVYSYVRIYRVIGYK